MKKAQAVVAATLLAPAFALAFETIDTLPWPSAGRFPAYPAEPARPTNAWIQAGALQDDNILRQTTSPQSDTVMRLGAGVRHEQRIIGRQDLILEARADYYDFQEFNSLSHLAYAGLADWRWEVGNQLSGSMRFGRERRLAELAETQSSRRTMVTLTRASADGGYTITPNLRVRAGAGWSAAERDDRLDPETRATSFVVGADYLTPLRTRLGVEARATEGEAPEDEDVFGTLVNNDYSEREVSLVAGYALGARLTADARLGRTTRRYDQIPGRDFEGTTWRVGAEWLPANKTSLAVSFYKEPRSIIDIAASHVLVRGVSFGPSWAATAKLVFSARLLREEREFQGDPALVVAGTTLRDETIDAWRLGVGWEPQRHWQVGVGIAAGERTSNLVGRGYDFTTVMANVAWRY